MIYNPDFLRKLDEHREKITYARIISLTMDEDPVEQIEGQITQGSVNVDGNSAVRRTCSLSMVAQDVNINEYYWGLNTKFKLEIGVQNKVDPQYPDVIWFKMGTYVITSFNASLSTNSYTISLQGKDKMCLLNGDVGGIINARTDFGTYDFTDTETGITVNEKYPIKQIIWDAVHAYANEPFHNIIINDLDELGLELLDYKYDVPMYLFREPHADEYSGIFMIGNNSDIPIYKNTQNNAQWSLTDPNFIFDKLIASMIGYDEEPTHVFLNSGNNQRTEYVVAKIEYGQTAGYRTCDLVYAGDLIANIGDSLTSVLDKIKNMLGQFEYFYDLDGRFVFQRQKSLVNTVWTPIRETGDRELYVESLAAASNSMYDFHGSILISSFQNNPNLLNLRNDYTVWGVKKGVTGQEYPVHMRYAIDNKPEIYADFNGKVWTTLSAQEIENINKSKNKKSIRAEIYKLWDEFERDYTLYPQSLWRQKRSGQWYIPKEEKWWVMSEWAEYYKILFGEYPGNRHPQDEMRNLSKTGRFPQTYMKRFASSTSPLSGTEANTSPTCEVMQLFFFKGLVEGRDAIGYTAHSGCVHTYAEWLQGEKYVNSDFPENFNFALSPADAFTSKTVLDNLHGDGLYKIITYCYDPYIEEAAIDARIAELEQLEEYVDPYDTSDYNFNVDWRELIYRMAIDYRRHNHDDDFEVRLAKNNSPWELYPKGVTGYEQYYTDMEGFWRELYNPMTDDNEIARAHLYNQASYSLQVQGATGSALDNIYIKGVYKPISKKVTSVAKERQIYGIKYIKDPTTGKEFPLENVSTKQYWLSETNGFTWGLTGSASTTYRTGTYFNSHQDEFLNLCLEGKVYTRDIPSVVDLFKLDNYSPRSMYPYMELQNYVYDASSNPTRHFIKHVDNTDPQNPWYELITDITDLNLNIKTGSYVLTSAGQSAYNAVLNTIDQANGNYDKLDDLLTEITTKTSGKLTSSEINTILSGQTFTTTLQNRCKDNLSAYYSAAGTSNYTITGFKTVLNSMTERQQQYDFAYRVREQAYLAIKDIEVKLIRAEGSLQYELYSAQLQKQLQSNVTNTLNTCYIYDSSNLYKLSDVIKNTALRPLYFENTQGRPVEKISRYGLKNNGSRAVYKTIDTKLNYYYRSNKYYDETEQDERKRFWRRDVFESPQSLIFWFDFLTGDGELRQFTTQAIGDRPKAVNDNNIKSIYYRDTPKIIFTTPEKLLGMDADKKTGYNYFKLPSQYDSMFSISAQGIDAKNKIDELIFQFSYCTESITIQAVPIYYLDVNKRISVYDPDAGINGEYVVSKITFPLAYNGMMSITATKAPENSVTEREE